MMPTTSKVNEFRTILQRLSDGRRIVPGPTGLSNLISRRIAIIVL